ncbi:MAG: glycine oxidase ThiO [Mariprofundaceae bacterium]
MNVVIVGGGVIGCLTACFLKQRGANVTLLERGHTGQEASWAGAGILSPIHPWRYPNQFSHIVNASLDLYPDLQAQLFEQSGIDIQWHRSGMLIPCFETDVIDHQKDAIAWSKQFNWSLETLNAAQALHLEPCLNQAILQSGLYWPEVAQLRNPRLMQAVLAWMKKLGVDLHEQCDVIGLEEDDNGQVCGVKSADGQSFHADAVLLAGGSWSGEIAGKMGFDLAISPVKGQVVLLQSEPGYMSHIVKHDDAYFVPRLDGRILVGASMEFVGFERGNTQQVVGKLLDAMAHITPGLKNASIEQQWMGFRPGTPDGMPLMGEVKGKPGLWVASGHYRNGVVLAPITAQCMSESIMGGSVTVDYSVFDPNRIMPEHSALGFPL